MQTTPRCNFIGIAYCGGQHPLAFATLDVRQKVQALSIGRLADLHAYCAGQTEALVVCGLPLARPLQGDRRSVEEELIQHGLPSHQTPAEPTPLHPAARIGMTLAEIFRNLGYTTDLESDAPLLLMESHPGAAYHNLLGLRPFRLAYAGRSFTATVGSVRARSTHP